MNGRPLISTFFSLAAIAVGIAASACARPVRQNPDTFSTEGNAAAFSAEYGETPNADGEGTSWDGDPQGSPATRAIASKEDLRIERAIASRDIILGMTTEDVQKSWGEPNEVLYSGHPTYGNQRWIYVIGVSGDSTVRSMRRVIDFEGGHVVAWFSR